MEFKKETRSLSQADADVLVVIVFQDEKVEHVLSSLDASFPQDFAAAVAQECARESFSGKAAQALQLPTYGKLAAGRLFIKGGGKRDESSSSMRRAIGPVARRLSSGTTGGTVAVHLPFMGADAALVQAVIEGWLLGSYQFKKYKTSADDKKRVDIKQLSILNCPLSDADFDRAVQKAQAIAESTNMARDMVAEPADYMTPTRLATIATSLVSDRRWPR